MDIEGSRLQQPAPVKRERLEDRYGKIAMPALAAAVGSASKEKNQRQMSAEAALTRLQQMAQD